MPVVKAPGKTSKWSSTSPPNSPTSSQTTARRAGPPLGEMDAIHEYIDEGVDQPLSDLDTTDAKSLKPPSFAQSEFQTIIRRQRHGTDPDGLKIGHAHLRNPDLNNDWEFSGWGSTRYLDITPSQLDAAAETLKAPRHYLNQLLASSVAGNGLVGSVFYTFPLVSAVAGIYAPICLIVASLLLSFWRPLMLELASAARLNGANYVYLLQFAGKTMAVIGATATLLDAMLTSTVSAATASTYLSGEFTHLALSPAVITIILLVGFAFLALAGLRESAVLSATVFTFHLFTMCALGMASAIHWGRTDPGSSILRANWEMRPDNALDTVRAFFYGICIAFLGVTGFECTPSYIENVRPRTYSAVLRNLITIATLMNGTLCLFVYAVLPSQTITQGDNVLSVLAEEAAGRWLRVWIVVDAVGVLLGGVLTGVVTSTQLLDRLARDRVLPQFFLLQLPVTKSAYVATLTSLGLSLLLYLASGMELSTVSSMFSVTFLFVLFLYVLSNLLLKLNRPYLAAEPRAGMLVVVGAFVVVITTWAGNIALDPTALALFAAAFLIILAILLLVTTQSSLLRLALRLHAASPFGARGQSTRLVRWYKRSRNSKVCVWIKNDNIHTMLEAILSVRANSSDACTIVFVHAYPIVEHIPSELHPNTRLLDEAFPTITIDLSFVQGEFSPALVEAASRGLDIPRSRMCIVSLGKDHQWELADYGGARVIM